VRAVLVVVSLQTIAPGEEERREDFKRPIVLAGLR
jgi:hypothetical protein